jgi:hypothetical protein
MNWKKFGRKKSGHNLRYCPGLCPDRLNKVKKLKSVRTVGVTPETRTEYLPN